MNTHETTPATYVAEMNALTTIEDIVSGDLGEDIAAVLMLRDPDQLAVTLGVAIGLLRSALDAEPGRTVLGHIEQARTAVMNRPVLVAVPTSD